MIIAIPVLLAQQWFVSRKKRILNFLNNAALAALMLCEGATDAPAP